MSNWLAKLRPPKYLRYLFYIVYSFYRSYKSERNEAPVTAIIFLAFAHMFFFFSIFTFLFSFYLDTLNIKDITIDRKIDHYLKLTFFCAFTLNCIVFYFSFYQKRKWKEFVKEFEHLKRKDRRKGTIYLFIYLFIIFFILFPLSIYVMVQNSPYYK